MRGTFGAPEPLGVTLGEGGANVAVFSAEAELIELCLFDGDGHESGRLALSGRTGDVHHGFVAGLGEGHLYGFRAHGPWRPQEGLRFNPAKLLLDPYATRIARPQGLASAMAGRGIEGFDDLTLDPTDTAPLVPKGVVERALAPGRGSTGPRPAARIIYELNVKGFTQRHPDIPQAIRGTLRGLAHPVAIRHLVALGITTVELMPLAAWLDERHLPALGLSNYWGYNPITFLAPDPRLAPGGMAEVAAAVERLHEAGLEVILDVVFNHTAESDERGQTLSLRGLDNRTYYRLAADPRFYVNDTGCGHTLALDRPPVIRLVMDALRHWALVAGVDAFRFDLATTLARTKAGFDPQAPLLAAIGQDPVLRDRLMVAEPWDIGPGGYRLGDFPALWAEWNDRYRDDVRRFWRGDGNIGQLATRLAGSSDIFAARHRRPSCSVNFVAAHDGFSLADLVTYAEKRNEPNGEHNRDGHAGEVSWASAAGEAPGAVRALLATLVMSRGTPMLAMGDELGRTQSGNNNAYAQDNESTWVDWAGVDASLVSFVARLIALRRSLEPLTENRFLTGLPGPDGQQDVTWLSLEGRPMAAEDWSNPSCRTLGMMLAAGDRRLLVWFNAGREPLSATLPEARLDHRWRLVLDTSLGDPGEGGAAPYASFDHLDVPRRSLIALVEEKGSGGRGGGGVAPALLDRLAALAGIAPDWWEVSGRHTIVSPETKLALLAAMGLPAATLSDARESHERLLALASAPQRLARNERCFVPDALARGGRRYGLAAQLYTLRRAGDQAIGDLTTLRRLAEGAAARGAATLALNPLHTLFPSNRQRVSPYQPSDRRFLDPIYIDLDAVPEIAAARPVLDANERALKELSDGRLVDWAAVWRIKRAALELTFEAAMKEPTRRVAIDRFRRDGGEALERFALFQALEEKTGGTTLGFPKSLRKPSPGLSRAIDFAVYLQALADEQLQRAADAGLAVGLYRDLAVGAAPDGAEVWSSPDAFMKGVTIGAPPDPFSAAGQIWNIPPLDPMALRRTDFAHVRALLRANMRYAGALRVDHAMGLTRLFVIPEGAPASAGAYVHYPFESMLRALAEESRGARCLVVGEDLGTVPDGFRERMALCQAFSYRVLFFERDGDVFRPPEAYPSQAVACIATHDLPTLRGWWNGADLKLDRALGRLLPEDVELRRDADRKALAALVGKAPKALTPALAAAIHFYLARSLAALVLVQADDLAGEEEPVNLPGTESEYPNWRRRLAAPVERLLDTSPATEILSAMKVAGRV
jgi:glycogen operon protein